MYLLYLDFRVVATAHPANLVYGAAEMKVMRERRITNRTNNILITIAIEHRELIVDVEYRIFQHITQTNTFTFTRFRSSLVLESAR